MCGFVEVKRWQDFRKPGSQTEKGSFLGFESSFKPVANGYPGGIFDPLGLSRCVCGHPSSRGEGVGVPTIQRVLGRVWGGGSRASEGGGNRYLGRQFSPAGCCLARVTVLQQVSTLSTIQCCGWAAHPLTASFCWVAAGSPPRS